MNSIELEKILEEIDSITINDLKQAYANILNNSNKVLSLVGDLDFEYALNILNNKYKNRITVILSINIAKNVDKSIKVIYIETTL